MKKQQTIRHTERGFTMLEMLIATAIFFIGITGLMALALSLIHICGLHEDGLYVGRQKGLHLVEREGLSVRFGEHNGLTAEGLGQGHPTLSELAGAKHQNLVAGTGQVGHRGFHGAGTATGQHLSLIHI